MKKALDNEWNKLEKTLIVSIIYRVDQSMLNIASCIQLIYLPTILFSVNVVVLLVELQLNWIINVV